MSWLWKLLRTLFCNLLNVWLYWRTFGSFYCNSELHLHALIDSSSFVLCWHAMFQHPIPSLFDFYFLMSLWCLHEILCQMMRGMHFIPSRLPSLVFYLEFAVFLCSSYIAIRWFFPETAMLIPRLWLLVCDQCHFSSSVVLSESPGRDFDDMQLSLFVSYLNLYSVFTGF